MPRSTGPTDLSGFWLNITSFECKRDFCYDIIPFYTGFIMFEEFSNRAAVISIVGNFKTSNDDAK